MQHPEKENIWISEERLEDENLEGKHWAYASEKLSVALDCPLSECNVTYFPPWYYGKYWQHNMYLCEIALA